MSPGSIMLPGTLENIMQEINREEMEQEIKRLLKEHDMEIIGLDDPFDFKCRGCGKCCRNRHDIVLSPKDVFRMAKHLGVDIESFLDTYCKVTADSSGMAVVVSLKAVGGNDRCPFLDGRKCQVHAVKPTICALYPIGRKFDGGIPNSITDLNPSPTVEYIHVQLDCEHKHRKQTVRAWLEHSGIPVNDAFYLDWNAHVTKMAWFIHIIKNREATDLTMQVVLEMFFQISYLNYDLEKDFAPQFEQNMKDVDENIEDFTIAAEALLPDRDGGDKNGQQG